jgi:hypothetical protein
MGDSKEREVNTQPSVNFTDNFFNALPVDARFNKVELREFVPTSGGSDNASSIRFHLEKREAPQCYLISKTLIQLDFTVTKEDKTSLPTTTSIVAGVNNTLHSLFSEVSTSINGQNISGSKMLYPYKAYLGTLLTFDSEVKNSTLQMQGWANDKARTMGPEATNSGFIMRSQFLRVDDVLTNDFRAEGCTFIGKLYHELHTCDKPLPPHTAVDFYLTRESSEFSLMSKSTDTEKYKAIVKNVKLFVPVAWLTEQMYKEIEIRFPKQTMKYHFRRLSVITYGIEVNKRETLSDSLFSESENPTRIFFALVDTKAYQGDINKNPFEFGRKWFYEATAVQTVQRNVPSEQIVSDLVDKKLDSKFEVLYQRLGLQQQSSEPPTRRSSVQLDRRSSIYQKLSHFFGRSSQNEENPELNDEEAEALMSLLRGKQRAQPPGLGQSTSTSADPPLPADTDVEPAISKKFWLTKCQLEIDGCPSGKICIHRFMRNIFFQQFKLKHINCCLFVSDQLISVQTADQAKQDFFRLMNTNQMVNSLFTNAISYESFMNGYHIIAYDLTTAQDGGSEAFANPSVRVGKTYHNSKLLIRITIVWDSYIADDLILYNVRCQSW